MKCGRSPSKRERVPLPFDPLAELQPLHLQRVALILVRADLFGLLPDRLEVRGIRGRHGGNLGFRLSDLLISFRDLALKRFHLLAQLALLLGAQPVALGLLLRRRGRGVIRGLLPKIERA